MTKPSERIVVFVTTAQKRAITSTAENLGISVSELMRRAVLSFGATSEQVKAASIVDRLRAPRAPDALNVALQRVARGTRHARPALPAASQVRESGGAGAFADAATVHGVAEAATAARISDADGSGVESEADLEADSEVGSKADSKADSKAGRAPAAIGSADGPASTGAAHSPPAQSISPHARAAVQPAPLLPAGVAAALAAEQDAEAAATAEAVARLTAARAAEANDPARQPQTPQAGTPARLRNSLKRRRIDNASGDDESSSDPSTEGGRFA